MVIYYNMSHYHRLREGDLFWYLLKIAAASNSLHVPDKLQIIFPKFLISSYITYCVLL